MSIHQEEGLIMSTTMIQEQIKTSSRKAMMGLGTRSTNIKTQSSNRSS